MLKKYFSLILLVFVPLPSQALLDGDFGIDMYKKIDEGMIEMETQNYKYEATGQGERGVDEEFNRRLKAEGIDPCLDSLDTKDIKKIKSEDLQALRKVLKEDCLDEETQSISNDQAITLVGGVRKVDDIIIDSSEDKSKETYELARIGLYSDGSDENSPFDLVKDIQEIDKIIFCEKSEYNGQPLENTDSRFKDLIRGILRFIPPLRDDEDTTTSTGGTNSGTYITHITEVITTPIAESGSLISPYACSYDINTGSGGSGLDTRIIDTLIYNYTNSGTSSNSGGLNTDRNIIYTGSTGFTPKSIGTGAYTPVNDNKQWPCNEFFCIKIEFKMKQHNLLGGGQSICIQSILEKTDKHLKTFANTSLVQAKMTKNNFELGLLNLHLPDILHLGVQVFKKPVPMLKLEDEKDKNVGKKDEFAAKNLLYEKYKNLGWDYPRRNDLQEYKRKTEELKSILGCAELTNEECDVKVQSAYKERIKAGMSQAKNEYTSKAITKKASYEDADVYFKEFTEIERFGESLRDFVFSASGIIRNMNDIPENN